MSAASITVRPNVSYGTIRPEVYGHFAEHLGRCIYEGLWVGEESAIPHRNGIRNDTVDALARIRPPIIRWPGGCFADVYHWEDGIGPRAERPGRPNHWWSGTDTNAFGTHEFLEACERMGAQPYLCLNVGTGTPREALDWLEYCNYEGDTAYTRMRAANGHPAPWRVKYWAVGNENWGCGGRFTARDYAKEYRRYATYLRQLDPKAELVACGFDTREWNVNLLDELRDSLNLVDHVSIHKYTSRGPGRGFSDVDYWLLMTGVEAMERLVDMTAGLIEAYTSMSGRSIGIALDEWGVWHSEATIQTGHLQPNTVRDSLFAASSFHMFHRRADVLSMTNIAQTINVLQCLIVTDGAKMALTPTYHVYDLYRPHVGAWAIVTDTESPSVTARDEKEERSIPVLDASASKRQDGTLTLSVVNRHPQEAVEARVRVDDRALIGVDAAQMAGAKADSENLPGEEPVVKPAACSLAVRNGEIVHSFPPLSVTVMRLRG